MFNLPEHDLINVAVSEVYLIIFLSCFSTFDAGWKADRDGDIAAVGQPPTHPPEVAAFSFDLQGFLGVICVSQTRMIKFWFVHST